MSTSPTMLQTDLSFDPVPHLQQVFIADYIHVSGTTLLFYDYLITFPREIRQIWSRGHVGITLLYAGTRYSALAARLILILAQTSWKGQNYLRSVGFWCKSLRIANLIALATSCSVLLWSQGIAEVVVFLSIAVFSALRAYALSGKNRLVLAMTMLLGLGLPAAHAYEISRATIQLNTLSAGCDSSLSIPPALYPIVAFGARGTTMGAELLVVAITLRATCRWYVSQASHTSRLDRILLRDSLLYFLALLLLNALNIVFLEFAMNGALADLATMRVGLTITCLSA
ncbi:hypothetical protein V8D89_002728 [Ganoderma adspersum]